MEKELSYYRLYLQRFLLEQEDRRSEDQDFLDVRSESAEEAFEQSRREGLTIDQSQECAMAALLEGFD